MEVREIIQCNTCGEEIGDMLFPGVIVQLPLFEDERELAWCSSECFRKDQRN